MSAEQCNRCRFWLLAENGSAVDEGEPYGWGWCRRNPPQLSERMSGMLIPSLGNSERNYDPEDVATVSRVSDCSLFPATWHDKWCGQFEPATTALMSALAERNRLITHLDSADVGEAEGDRGASRLNELDNLILKTPAATKDDLLVKLLLNAQINTEGSYLEGETAAPLVHDAQRLIGMGRVSPNVASEAIGVGA